MDKITERETHDLMNVESFSQLPFIRPAPPIKEKGIRLFGIEFGATTTTDDSESAETTNTTNNNNMNNGFDTDSTTINKDNNNNNNNNNNSNNSTENNVESNRRFECHYCCRNFPTSQALGGHQNAHKRERQHAKRAHLQSTMVHATSFTSDPHLYQHHHHHNPFINYRFTSSSSSSPTSYPTWNSNYNSSNSLINGSAARFYGTHSHSHPHSHANLASSYSQSQQQQQQQPINGSPLAFSRIPNGVVQTSNPSFNNNHERSFQPLLASDHERPSSSFSQVGIGPSASQNRYVYDSKRTSTVDHVSLDLHL